MSKNTTVNTPIPATIKMIIMRKHIYAVTMGIISSIVSFIVAVIVYECGQWGKMADWQKDIFDAVDCIITVLLFASCAFLLFNKKGFELETASSRRVFLSTCVIFLDFTISFIVSIVLAFTPMDTNALIMTFMISFGISMFLLLFSEFLLFHTDNTRINSVYDDVPGHVLDNKPAAPDAQEPVKETIA